MRLLIVEDHDQLARSLVRGLTGAGFATDRVATLEEASAAVATAEFDLVVLDLGLPDGDGLDMVRELRAARKDIPILIVTARDGLRDRIGGLNAGADDYLVKPFETEELVARIRALLRRPGRMLGMVLENGNISFDTTARETRVDSQLVPMSRRELALLELFMRRFGRVVPKEAIEESVYGYDEPATANGIEVLVHRLRRKLEGAGADLHIHTLRGVGYVFSEKPS